MKKTALQLPASGEHQETALTGSAIHATVATASRLHSMQVAAFGS